LSDDRVYLWPLGGNANVRAEVENATLRIGLAVSWLLLAAGCRTGEVPPPPAPAPPPVARPEPETRPAIRPLAVGAILPGSGSEDLILYGGLIREGIDLAIERHGAGSGRRPELTVRDDAGEASAAARVFGDLDGAGVLAVVGPLLSDALRATAAARTDSTLPILSPTASDVPAGSANVYSLNAVDVRGAEALASWAVRRGWTALALLYPKAPEFASLAAAFRREAERIGARIVADVAFDPSTTTFARDINRVRAARAQAVYVPASERDIRQLAPQFRYYGLVGVTLLGNETWLSDEVLRTVPQGSLEGVVASTPLPPDSALTGWRDFVRAYESRYRRSLDNPYPALGYDAASLVLEAARRADGGRSGMARALAGIRDFRGATGVLSIEDGRVTRRPFLVRIRAGTPELIVGGGGP
jgi:branched-chain amino acid transport system substrate-binding protein